MTSHRRPASSSARPPARRAAGEASSRGRSRPSRRASRRPGHRGYARRPRMNPGPSNEAPSRLIRDCASARACSCTASPTSTAARSATAPRVGPFVEIQADVADRRPLQDPEPYLHLRRRDDRGRRLRRPRRDLRQRQAAARHRLPTASSPGPTTGSALESGRARGDDRLRARRSWAA